MKGILFVLYMLNNWYVDRYKCCVVDGFKYFLIKPHSLKVVSAILGRDINDHIHLIFLHDPLASCPISRPAKKHVSFCRLFSEIVHKNKWYYQPIKTKIISIPTNHRHEVGVVGFLLDAWDTEGRGELALFVWDLASNTNRSDVTQHRWCNLRNNNNNVNMHTI